MKTFSKDLLIRFSEHTLMKCFGDNGRLVFFHHKGHEGYTKGTKEENKHAKTPRRKGKRKKENFTTEFHGVTRFKHGYLCETLRFSA
jgi:hypothetical protein